MNSEIEPANTPTEGFSKNYINLFLGALLVFSFLGINILAVSGNLLQSITNVISPIFSDILYAFGYTTGNIINKSADVVANTAKLGIDVADGVAHEVGDLLIPGDNNTKDEREVIVKTDIIEVKKPDIIVTDNAPKSDKSENPIQNSIASNKMSWCLVGEYESKRGCVSVTDADKCLSGQMYPSQQMCINPNFSPNMQKN